MANSKPDLGHVKLLIEAAQKGDKDALGEIYKIYSPQVYRYILSRVRHPQVAEDLTSETFVRVCKGIGSFRWDSPGGWIITIAKNLVKDHYKSSYIRPEAPMEEVTDLPQDEYMPSPESVFVQASRLEVLIDAIRRLPSEQRRCIALRFLRELSTRETAREMGKTYGAVKTLQYRAIQKLRESLPADTPHLE